MPAEPTWTPEDVELVADATEQHYIADYDTTDAMGNHPCVCGRWWDAAGDNPGWDQHMAEAVLAALAEAGRLREPGDVNLASLPDGPRDALYALMRREGWVRERELAEAGRLPVGEQWSVRFRDGKVMETGPFTEAGARARAAEYTAVFDDAAEPVRRWVGPWQPVNAPAHASPNCACGVNDAGQRYIDPICRRR